MNSKMSTIHFSTGFEKLKCNGRRDDDMSSFRFVMVKLGYIEQHIIFKFIFLRKIQNLLV